MKNTCLFLMITVFFIPLSNAQDLESYFAREGLSINSLHTNFFDGSYSNAYTYYGMDILCGDEVLVFIENTTAQPLYLLIEDQKMYHCFGNCYKKLMYDFGMEIGDVLSEGLYNGWELVDKYPITLMNGEERMRYDLSYSGIYSASWVEGIGDISAGLRPLFEDFEGWDELACVKEGNELIWLNEGMEGLCDSLSCITPVISFSTEVVDWELIVENNTAFADTYTWDFGDGTFSNEENPIHQYDEPGCYELSLKVESACYEGEFTILQNVSICIAEPWELDYQVDDFTSLKVYQYADDLEFAYETNTATLYRTTDGGQSFTPITLPPVPTGVQRLLNEIKMFDAQNGVMVCGHYGASVDQMAILVTHDGGLSWEEKVPGSYFMLRVAVAPDGKAWAVGSSGRFYRTFDYGDTWENLNVPNSLTISRIQYLEDGTLIGLGSNLFNEFFITKSYTDGDTWDVLNAPVNISDWYFFDENIGYAKTTGTGLAKTIDGGQTWTTIALDFEVQHFSFMNSDVGWLVDNNGLIYYTTDAMQSFSTGHCSGEEVFSIQAITEEDAYFINAANYYSSGNIKKRFNSDVMPVDCTTGVEETVIGNTLLKIYPNPANKMLTVELLNPFSHIVLTDIRGQKLISNGC